MIISVITKYNKEANGKYNHIVPGQVCIANLTDYIEVWIDTKPEKIKDILNELVNLSYYPILIGLPNGKTVPAYRFLENEVEIMEPKLPGPLLVKEECNGIPKLLVNEKIQRIKIRKDGTIKIWLKEAIIPSEIVKEGIRLIKPTTIPPTISKRSQR